VKVTIPISSVSTMIISHGETAEQRAGRYRAALEQIKALPSHRQDEANQIAVKALESQ